MDETDAHAALTRLGLSTYEARVFVALQRLGTGTASDVAEVADVPRSQVYGAADNLETRGLIEVQQATPRRYRPVSLDAARDHLREQFEADSDRAFDYIADVQGELGGGEETPEAVWTVTGGDAVTDRIVELAADAEDRVLFGTGDLPFFTATVREALVAAAGRGVTVLVASANEDVIDAANELDGVDALAVESPTESAPPASRVALVDGHSVVLAVGNGATETAIWSADSRFAAVLVDAMESWFAREVED